MVQYIDVHCHLDYPGLIEDIDNVINRAAAADVKIVTSGISPESIRKSLEFVDKYNVQAMLGIYPTETVEAVVAGKFDFDSELDFIKKEAKKNRDKIIGIGEIGLDYQEDAKHRDVQKECFEKQLALAEKLNLPVLIHSRKAEADCIEILETTKLKNIIMHCFCGKLKLVKRAADNGWHFTVPTKITRLQQFQLLAKEVNINQLFAETDAPFMSPFAGAVNEPAFVVESYKKIAEIKGFEVEHVRENLFLNYTKVFG